MSKLTLSAYQETEVAVARDMASRGFVVHLGVTVVVSLGLIALNVFVASEFPWAIFPVVGMGIGVFVHWYFGVKHIDTSVREHQSKIERRAA